MRGGRRQKDQIAAVQIFAARVQAITFAQTPPRAIARDRFALLFGHHKRRAHFVRFVCAPVRFQCDERMAHALAIGKSAVELRAGKALVRGSICSPNPTICLNRRLLTF